MPAVVSQHQTGRVRVPLEPQEGPQLPQPPNCHSTQLGLAHDVDVGPQPPHVDSAVAVPSE